jgi:hypothetical protein
VPTNSSTPYQFFRINNPGLGGWTFAVVEVEEPDTTEPIRVYIANEADLILEFKSDKERYWLQYDENGNPIPVQIELEATLIEGGETSGLSDHTKTVGTPVNDALVGVQVTAPDGQTVIGNLAPSGLNDGKYYIVLQSDLIGNYDVSVIASDNIPVIENGDTLSRNSQYLITTEHSFYVSPYDEPTELTGKLYIQMALQLLDDIMDEYCPGGNQGCNLDNNTKKNINSARSLISAALGFFEDGNHLKLNKGLSFYDKITSAVNDIYAYINVEEFGEDIDLSIQYLKEGSYKLALIAKLEAEEPDACQVNNCEELLKNVNTELGKALLDSKQKNYVYVFNHLTNAWKFAMNVLGYNLKKVSGDTNNSIPTVYALEQNYPNPFNPTTTINYQLPEKGHANLRVYDILGNLVTTLLDEELNPGYYSVTWDASGLASGIYFYRLNSGSFVSTKKLILLK